MFFFNALHIYYDILEGIIGWIYSRSNICKSDWGMTWPWVCVWWGSGYPTGESTGGWGQVTAPVYTSISSKPHHGNPQNQKKENPRNVMHSVSTHKSNCNLIKHDNGKSAKLEKKNPRKGFILALMFNQTVLISVSITFYQQEAGANIYVHYILH